MPAIIYKNENIYCAPFDRSFLGRHMWRKLSVRKMPYCHCGYFPNRIDIHKFCSRHSWNQACCRCIISRESGGNANAMNFNSNGSFDVGIWQIN